MNMASKMFTYYQEAVNTWVKGLNQCQKCGEWRKDVKGDEGLCGPCIKEIEDDHVYGEYMDELLAQRQEEDDQS